MSTETLDEPVVEETTEQQVEAPDMGGEPLEPLTEREIAVAQGKDPDDVAVVVETESAKDGEVGVDDGDGTEAAPDPDSTDEPVVDEPAAETTTEDTWVDGVRDLASSYNITDDELQSFGSAEEFARATRLLDQNLISSADTGVATAIAPQPPAGQPLAQDAEDTPSHTLDPQKYIDANYDEETVAIVRAHNSLAEENRKLQQFAANMQAQQQDAADQRRVEEFDMVVDTMTEGRYGRRHNDAGQSVELKDVTFTAREKLYNTANLLLDGIYAQADRAGKQAEVPALPVLLKRAEQVAFSDEIRQDEQRAFQDKVAAQSKRRRSAGTVARKQAPIVDPDDPVAMVSEDPRVVKAWKQMQEDNGA
jgi:hypothetical protein